LHYRYFFASNTLFPSSQTHRRYALILIPLEYRELLAKNNFRTKIGRRTGLGEHPEKFWDPFISATI